MKKLLIALALFSLPVSANTHLEKDPAFDKAMRDLITAYGYRCDKIDNAMRSAWSGDFTVYCNANRYRYEVKDKGGRWVVTID